MKKKILSILFLVLILIANFSFASYSTVKMEVVEEPICEIKFGQNSKFQKQLISKDLNNKEVTIELKVTNEDEVAKPTGELVLLLDNSHSTDSMTNQGATRRSQIQNSAKTLITNLLKDNSALKISVVTFASLNTSNYSEEGTIKDANVLCSLTNDATKITNSLTNIPQNGPRTNLEAGLELAYKQFSNEKNNKYIIVLTDGIPNLSLFESTATTENKQLYSDYSINRTKNKLKEITKNDVTLITMLTGIDTPDTIVSGTTKTYSDIIKEVFGTAQTPTSGMFYYISDDDIEKTITTDIYNSLMPTNNTFKDIVIEDYFPDEIVKNFDFAYVKNANIGNISTKIDEKTNKITWTIPELEYGKTAVVQYKLKLKQDFDSSIVDKILNTNQKIDMKYKDFNDKEQNETSNITPKLRLTEPKEAPQDLPKAGNISFALFITIISGASIFFLIKFVHISKKMK